MKVVEQFLSNFSISKIPSSKSIEIGHDAYRGKDCMKRFCEYLREHAIETTNLKKKMNLLTKEQQELYKNAKICYIC